MSFFHLLSVISIQLFLSFTGFCIFLACAFGLFFIVGFSFISLFFFHFSAHICHMYFDHSISYFIIHSIFTSDLLSWSFPVGREDSSFHSWLVYFKTRSVVSSVSLQQFIWSMNSPFLRSQHIFTGSYCWSKTILELSCCCLWMRLKLFLLVTTFHHLLMWPTVLIGITCTKYFWAKCCPGPFQGVIIF